MADAHGGLGHQLTHLVREVIDVLDPVVQQEHLPAAVHLPQDRLPDELIALLGDVCLDRQPLFRRGFHGRHVSHAGERHVQRSRDRRCAERQDIHLRSHALQALLVNDAEPMLFIDDYEPQVVERHILLEHPVCADADVNRPVGERLHHLPLFRA